MLASIAARIAGLRRSSRPTSTTAVMALGACALMLAGCTPDHYPQTTLLPLSDFARIGDAVQSQTLYWAVGVFVLVEGALLYAMFRFRGKPNDPEPTQVHGNTVVEIIWTLIPALILAAIAVPTVKGIFKTNATPQDDPLVIEIVGHQWWWEFRYPEYQLVTANELHIPVGRTVAFKQISADVIHSFWPPRFAGKRDVFPGRETRLWFKAESAGEYPGQCAEFCGIEHGRMSFRIRAQEPADFEAWVAHMHSLGPKQAAAPAAPAPVAAAAVAGGVQTASAGATAQAPQAPAQDSAQAPAPTDSLYAAGEKLFAAKGCVGCHSLQPVYQGKEPAAMVGPNLGNVGARSWIAAGTLQNTDENLARWIRNAQAVKPGVLMPNLGVTEPEAHALVAFLRAHQ